jgi:hypothetical protein
VPKRAADLARRVRTRNMRRPPPLPPELRASAARELPRRHRQDRRVDRARPERVAAGRGDPSARLSPPTLRRPPALPCAGRAAWPASTTSAA